MMHIHRNQTNFHSHTDLKIMMMNGVASCVVLQGRRFSYSL